MFLTIKPKVLWPVLQFILVLILLPAATPDIYAAGKSSEKSSEVKVSDVGQYNGYCVPEYKGFNYSSLYITMRDSVKLAVDVFLPKRLKAEKVPTIIYLTRYVRSLRAKIPFKWLKHPVLAVVPEDEIKFLTSHGYACIIVDVRGSGASLGERYMEFSPAEVKDGSEIVDWVIKQPWSNGNVASTGVSYVGTTAELLLINKHPAVKACIPRSNIFDLYNHVMFPGGVRQGPFIKIWGYTTQSLDGNNLAVFGKQAKRLIKGINPVKSDKRKVLFKEALELHKGNFDVYEGIFKINCRDEVHPGLATSANEFSIHSNLDAVESSGTALYRIGGWYDGALCKSVIEGYLNTSNTQKVLIGPWDHGPHDNASPFAMSKELKLNVKTEMLRFFDYYLKGIENGIDNEKAFYYYTVGEEKWKKTEVWPLEDQVNTTLYFSGNNNLVSSLDARQEGEVAYKIDYTATTGPTSRWNSQTALYKNGHTDYPDRKDESAKLLNFTSKPFATEVEMTGHTIIDVYLSADADDATVFCYIEDVGPDGSVTYVTEGLFRPMHRKVHESPENYNYPGPYHSYKKSDVLPLVPGETVRLKFDLLPISYLFKEGHSLRVSIAGCDDGHFDLPEIRPENFTVSFSEEYPSRIIIPEIKKSQLNTGFLLE